jgi:hypothetical protein
MKMFSVRHIQSASGSHAFSCSVGIRGTVFTVGLRRQDREGLYSSYCTCSWCVLGTVTTLLRALQ